MSTLLPYERRRWLQKLQDIALPQIAWLAQGLKIFFDRLAIRSARAAGTSLRKIQAGLSVRLSVDAISLICSEGA